jgi:hypothetical protein
MNALLRRIGNASPASAVIFLVALLALVVLFTVHNGEQLLAEVVVWQITTAVRDAWAFIDRAVTFIV